MHDEAKALKPFLTCEEQLALLSHRGLIIEDPAFARKVLSEVNYYRLFGGYAIGLTDVGYFNGITFSHIYSIYRFDVRLRNLVSQLIEPIEVKLRSRISNYICEKHGAYGYMDVSNFADAQQHRKFISRLFSNYQAQYKSSLILKHHDENYGGKIPFWAAMEFVTFGQLSKFYANMKPDDQKRIACEFSVKVRPKHFRSWLKALVETRNICAHYSRLYNTPLTMRPSLMPEHEKYLQPITKVFVVLLTLKYMTDDRDDWSKFVKELVELIAEFNQVNLSFIGFPREWEAVLRA